MATSSPCKITLTRRHSGCCYLDLPLMSSAMFEAAFASQQLSHRRATDFRKKTLSTTSSFLSSLSKFYQGLQQCRPSYCMAYHPKPLDAAPGGAAWTRWRVHLGGKRTSKCLISLLSTSNSENDQAVSQRRQTGVNSGRNVDSTNASVPSTQCAPFEA